MAAQQEIFVEEWDKKKILLGIFFLMSLVGIFFGVKYLLAQFGFGNNPALSMKSVQGIEVHVTPTPLPVSVSLPSTQDVVDKVQQIQEQVSSINVGDLAKSSPEIQDVIKQLQQLPQVPASIAKDTCIQLCSKL